MFLNLLINILVKVYVTFIYVTYNKKTVSNEFNKFHSADDAYEMLELAIKLKEYNFCKYLLFI